MKAKHLLILLCAAVIYLVFLATGIRDETIGKEMQAQAEAMFVLVQPLPGATLLEHSAHHKGSDGLVSSSYQTDASFTEIRSYYDTELAKHGWSFVSEKPVVEWGKDTGRHVAYYKNSKFRGDIYSGEGRFSLYFSW